MVLLGLIMPGMSGEELLETVVADDALATRHTYIVVSGAISHAREGRVRELRERLNAPFLAKPFTADQLLSAVKQAVARLGEI